MIGTLEKRPGQTIGQATADTEEESAVCVDTLVSRAQNGQADAFGLLYEEYIDRVYRYVYVRIGHIERAEDMTQEVFLRAFESIANYRHLGKPFLGWLLRIAHNLIVDHYRREDKRHFLPLDDAVSKSALDPVTTVEQTLEMAEVIKATMSLPPAQRDAFSLRFMVGLSIAEAAAVMGKSEGAVKTLQHEAVVKLRKMMKRWDDDKG